MRSRRLQNLAAGTAEQLDTKLDKVGGDISGDLAVSGSLQVNGAATLASLLQVSDSVGIGTSAPVSALNIKGVTPTVTLGDTRNLPPTAVIEPIGRVDFSSDDTSSGGTLNKVRARIQAFTDPDIGSESYASHGISFHAVNIVDGVLREHMRMSSRGAVSIGMSRTDQTNLTVKSNNVGSARYGIVSADVYNGAAPNYIGFSSVGPQGGTRLTGAIGSFATDKSTTDDQITGTIDFLTKPSSNTTPQLRMRVKPTGQVNFVPLAADPSGASAGDVYYNSTTNKLRVHNGTSWVDLH